MFLVIVGAEQSGDKTVELVPAERRFAAIRVAAAGGEEVVNFPQGVVLIWGLLEYREDLFLQFHDIRGHKSSFPAPGRPNSTSRITPPNGRTSADV
jgi:hypothetical protein